MPRTWLYVIECTTPNHRYVGVSKNPTHREAIHRAGQGAAFTKQHGVAWCEIIASYPDAKRAKVAERDMVLKLRAEGFEVRGAGWTADKVKFAIEKCDTAGS